MNGKTCEGCQQKFEPADFKFQGRVVFEQRYCDPCVLKFTEEEKQRPHRERKEALQNRFKHIVPPIYHKTDTTKLQTPLRSIIDVYTVTSLGVGLIGGAGKGKTRAGVCLLKKAMDQGHEVFFIAATDIGLHAANQFAEQPATKQIALSTLACCRSADLLMIDDIGKGRMTDRAESTLYEILEYRTSNELPTIWTSNSDRKGLLSMFSEDRAGAIVRRLSEFCKIVIC